MPDPGPDPDLGGGERSSPEKRGGGKDQARASGTIPLRIPLSVWWPKDTQIREIARRLRRREA